jgi:hypothetical protein
MQAALASIVTAGGQPQVGAEMAKRINSNVLAPEEVALLGNPRD